MKFLFRLSLCFVFLASLSCNIDQSLEVRTPSIIPAPTKMTSSKGYFTLDKNTSIIAHRDFDVAVSFLRKYIEKGTGIDIKEGSEMDATIQVNMNVKLKPEAYRLTVYEDLIRIEAADKNGAFYAMQSLRQLLPEALENEAPIETKTITIPKVTISDVPKFPYRGMHLDVGRHFFDKEFIKEYIAHLSMLKMNYFHWHLTEDQGWRVEILQYPELTEIGAFREETLIGHYNDTPQKFDGKRYGGFYTQEDIKEIVAFAAQQNVIIIPEIEMPGHAQAAISAYPELGCTEENVPVATKWGVFDEVYCPKEETFTFLKNVLSEVIELFPGEYIHIGGDEAPKTHWKNCADCQKLIKDLGLKDEHELQSYFIKEIETFVNSKGKKIIGWDEILEGGLAPNATVMSWRGTQGAIEAAKAGHDVILTPTSHAYFDYYQATHEDEPTAIGGFLPLKKVYSFNPIPSELAGKEAKHVLGAQGNIWTEYMPTEDQVEYMAFPRMLAMSEVVWNGTSENLEEDYPLFLERVERFMPRMDVLDINYANHLNDIYGTVTKNKNGIFYELSTVPAGKKIVYSTANVEKDYQGPIPITETTQISATVLLENGTKGRPFSETINYHKGVNASATLTVAPHKAYNAGGTEALLNGVSGSNNRFGDKEWLGFWGDDLEITILFPEPIEISKVSTRFYNANGQWVYSPNSFMGRIETIDGQILTTQSEIEVVATNNTLDASLHFTSDTKILTKKLIIMVPNYGVIGDGLQGAGNKAWTFIDEIIIE